MAVLSYLLILPLLALACGQDKPLQPSRGQQVGPTGKILALPWARLEPDPSTFPWALDGSWHTFQVQTDAESLRVKVNTDSVEVILELATGHQAPISNYCPGERNDEKKRKAAIRSGMVVYLQACGEGQAEVVIEEYVYDHPLQSYTFQIEPEQEPGDEGELPTFRIPSGGNPVPPPVVPVVPVDIPNQLLQWIVEQALGKEDGEDIFPEEMKTLTHLSFSEFSRPKRPPWLKSASIRGLAGLEYAVNLEYLGLNYDCILGRDFWVERLVNLRELRFNCGLRNLLTLSNISKLTYLDLSDNYMPELHLAGLDSLKTLIVRDGRLPKLTLVDLPSLENAWLSGAGIKELSLKELPSLEVLELSYNSVIFNEDNLPALIEGLKDVRVLNLEHGNSVGDAAWLLELKKLEVVGLRHTRLTKEAYTTYIPLLRKRGVAVFDEQLFIYIPPGVRKLNPDE